MGIIPTVRNRKQTNVADVPSSKREESILRSWDFTEGVEAKSLRLYGQGASAGSLMAATSDQGQVGFSRTLPADSLSLTAQTASSTGTIVAAASGEYLFMAYIEVTTAGAAGTLDVTATITDDVGAKTHAVVTALSTAATNVESGLRFLRCSGGGIDYTVTLTAGIGTTFRFYIDIIKVR